MPKTKHKRFQIKQNERIAKRERKQKANNKLMKKMGGRFNVSWLERIKAIAARIKRTQKKKLTKKKI